MKKPRIALRGSNGFVEIFWHASFDFLLSYQINKAIINMIPAKKATITRTVGIIQPAHPRQPMFFFLPLMRS